MQQQQDQWPEYDFALFKKIVRTTFNQRRKTILNTLSEAGFFLTVGKNDKAENKTATEMAIIRATVSPAARPETLTVRDFMALARAIEQLRISAASIG